ncbi:WbqC family protein [Croceimicrobium hydrocarbonivorans]|uniref:WbqC family protein n=1 Tax=Croceimicrobium hydrocarbonivorans TaxID=2761580 RepID=A0A7H0VE37_9FLAO|nr:WbqC family protein [Croceimicrobium hydrocarbonivorans]QNR23985.1 WbqC family protein [Croceimicrobium hydrocarbonivorans]
MIQGLFSLTYWGPVSYYAQLIRCDQVILEQYDRFQKQTYRNRCYIDGPNGELMLNLAIDKNSRGLMRDTQISERDHWPQQHWQALNTSYGGSPFFDALAPEIEALFAQAPQNLAELNLATTQLILKWLRFDGIVQLSESWLEPNPVENDFRESFSPKLRSEQQNPAYPQVFDHKTAFKSELSVLDLIFNEGPAAYDYLRQL